MTAAPDTEARAGAGAPEAGPLSEVVVIELGDELPAYAGRLLAAAGAYVVKVEPPGGAPSRGHAPFVDAARLDPASGETPESAESLEWAALNVGKHSIVLDLTTAAGRQSLAGLLERADVLLDGAGVGGLTGLGLGPEVLQRRNPGLICAQISPFGQSGPWAQHLSTDLTSLAMSGLLADCGYDDHELPPIRPTGGQAYNSAGIQAVIGVLVALIWRQSSGRGQFIDVSAHDAGATTIEFADLYWWYWQSLTQRQTARHAFPTISAPGHYETADGRYVVGVLILHHDHVWRDIKAWLAENDLLLDLDDPAYDDPVYRRLNQHLIHDRIAVLAAMMDSDDFYRRGQQSGWVVGTVRQPADLIGDQQLAARDFWHPIDLGSHRVQFPKSAIRVQGATGDLGRPPDLNADAEQIWRRVGVHATVPPQPAPTTPREAGTS